MRRILATCLLLALALPCQAQPKPNTLTPKEIADGWILLFDGETTKGWKVGGPAKGSPVAKDGQLDLSGIERGYLHSVQTYSGFELQFEYKTDSDKICFFGIETPMRDDKTRPFLGLLRRTKDWTRGKLWLDAGKVDFEVGDDNAWGEWNGPALIMFGGDKVKLRNIKLRPLEQKKRDPNTLTPREIANGWILLFDGESTFGWNVKTGTVTPKNGEIVLQGQEVGIASHSACLARHSYELVYEYAAETIDGQYGASLFLERRKGQPYLLDTKATDTQFEVKGSKLTWYRSKLRLDEEGFRENDIRPLNRAEDGVAKVSWASIGKSAVYLKNIKFRPRDTKSLFNGKDLDGWKEFPGKKSKFAVIDNAINVKDGPGELQTVGKYKDFILQLECKSNGKHLNSGIFFRCRDREYQNGYEAQIRNEFTEKATQKYQIEEYDPKTNKLIGKKEQHFTAVDYGTGAIYRRQPARKQMSKDGEWFAMTIVAHGNHFATWVNGVQVTDWTDNRPKSDNARTGCRLEGGHISIQGHDPTTDLSFKNLRIAELK